ncbi:MAG TPA: ABC transporter permease [Nitrolancea sp.]|nr:ABC transporter permease [Nitrolancea sp.]
MIRSIFKKDLKDAIRDSRVLIAILVPLGIGILYNFIFDDTTPKPSATIAWHADGSTKLLDTLRTVAGDSVDLTFDEQPSADAVRTKMADKDADIGIIVPAGFDAQLAQGAEPKLTVLLPEKPTFAGNYVAAAINPAIRMMAGQRDPAQVEVSQVASDTTSDAIFDRVGLRRYFVLFAVIMEIGMIAMLAVPIILTEEVEKRTMEALVLVASYVDIVIAKALVGVAYIVVASVLLLGVTRVVPERVALFILAGLALGITLIGFGLLLGGLFRNANQLNTWGGVVLLPVIAPAFVVGLPVPDWLQTLFDFLPTSQGARVMIDSMSSQSYFGQTWLSFLVIIVWAVAAYALLVYRLARRTA